MGYDYNAAASTGDSAYQPSGPALPLPPPTPAPSSLGETDYRGGAAFARRQRHRRTAGAARARRPAVSLSDAAGYPRRQEPAPMRTWASGCVKLTGRPFIGKAGPGMQGPASRTIIPCGAARYATLRASTPNHQTPAGAGAASPAPAGPLAGERFCHGHTGKRIDPAADRHQGKRAPAPLFAGALQPQRPAAHPTRENAHTPEAPGGYIRKPNIRSAPNDRPPESHVSQTTRNNPPTSDNPPIRFLLHPTVRPTVAPGIYLKRCSFVFFQKRCERFQITRPLVIFDGIDWQTTGFNMFASGRGGLL